MTPHALDLVRAVVAWWQWTSILAAAKGAVRYVSAHSGVPAIVVAALLVCLGYRVLKRSVQLAVEVFAVTVALAAASELGWLRW